MAAKNMPPEGSKIILNHQMPWRRGMLLLGVERMLMMAPGGPQRKDHSTTEKTLSLVATP